MNLKMSEGELLENILDCAQKTGWLRAHFRSVETKNKGWQTPVQADGAGFPDIVLVRERVIYAEVKSGIGKLSKLQEDWLGALSDAGQEVYVWSPREWYAGTIQKILTKRLENQTKKMEE